MNYLKEYLSWFNSQSKTRQLTLLASLAFLVLMTLAFCYWFTIPNYAVLFNQLDSRDANQIINQLEQANISYQLRNQGSDILIDKNLIDKTRIKLMTSTMQFSGSVGFELFDKSDFGLTDFSQKINYQRALQGELERTINSLDEVRQVRVHLVIPEQHLFQQTDNQPRAAISLQLLRPLTPQQVSSIQQLVSASVAKLQKSKVIIVDQNGNNLTNSDEDPASGHFARKKNMEHYLNEKVLQLLNRVFADEEFMVKIDVSLNYDELQRELVKPQQEGIITHEKETRHSTSTKAEKPQTNQDLTREKSYQFGTEKERFTRASGKIERLTISVVVPENTNSQTLKQIERLVKSVVGFDEKRGDTISVEALIAEQQTSVIPVIPFKQQAVSKDMFYLASASLVAILLVFLPFNFRRRQQKRQLLLAELTSWLSHHD
ncbi:Flagellar M-ring protein [Legionella massiliensis]|uniref:Flagellar M-ring protein n=1 Tax=Legionella massiliensis TaxID=1034943 RepID=A0A078KVQ0_9GAMM|nr:flagellar basal-body MS-ring/collar protein FliF [Legionella massiliensis]CDZ77061.1 Flagellar M-ring protein [Legionella massiliensis]CEE12799.1 Flagellar M-ring protein [Legionella massiliensis]